MYEPKIALTDLVDINPATEPARADMRLRWFATTLWMKRNPLSDFGIPTREQFDELCARVAEDNGISVDTLLRTSPGRPAHPARCELVEMCLSSGMDFPHVAEFMDLSTDSIRLIAWKRKERLCSPGELATADERQAFERIVRFVAVKHGVADTQSMLRGLGRATHAGRFEVIRRCVRDGIRRRSIAALMGTTTQSIKTSLKTKKNRSDSQEAA